MSKAEFGQLLEEILNSQRPPLSANKLAKEFGMSRTTIGRWIKGEDAPRMGAWSKLVQRFPDELAGITIVDDDSASKADAARPMSLRDRFLEKFDAREATEVEYYTMARASANSYRRILASDPSGHRFAPNQSRFKQGRIRVIGIRGDCMEPDIHDGEDVYFDTRGEIEEGVNVLAVVDDESLVVKQLRASGDGWALVPLKGGAPIPLESEDHILGVVLGVWRPLF